MKLDFKNKWTLIKVAIPVTLAFSLTYNVKNVIDKSDDDVSVTVNYYVPSPEDDGEFLLIKTRTFDETIGDSVATYTVLKAEVEKEVLRIPIGPGLWVDVYAPKKE